MSGYLIHGYGSSVMDQDADFCTLNVLSYYDIKKENEELSHYYTRKNHIQYHKLYIGFHILVDGFGLSFKHTNICKNVKQ